MKNASALLCLSLLLPAFVMGGCSRIKDEMGLSRRTPDEFAVMQRAPLVVPEDLSALPAPNPGAPRPMETPATAMAKSAVLGDTGGGITAAPSNAESALLQRAGASQVQNGIRATVNRETKDGVEDKRPVIKRLMGLGDEQRPATVVDPAAEARRIQDAKKAGKPLTTGETPTVQQ